jgi:hypothetical protein
MWAPAKCSGVRPDAAMTVQHDGQCLGGHVQNCPADLLEERGRSSVGVGSEEEERGGERTAVC